MVPVKRKELLMNDKRKCLFWLIPAVLVLLAVVNLRESRADHRLKAEHHTAPAAPHPNRSKLHKTLRRVGAGLAACVLVVTLIVTGRSARSDRVVNVCSWGEYIDESLITQFEEETGIRVNYQTAESNEALYSLIKMGGADFDVIVPSDYMIARLIDEDMLAELDYSHIPNFDLIADTYKNLSFDPENRYTVPYTWGTLGIIYNTTMVSQPITSWSAMFDPQYAGQVLMINNSRDALAAALLYLGYSINTTDESQLEEAFALLKQAKDSGVYQAFVMDEVFQKMEGGNAAVAMYYAGDYLTMSDVNEDLGFYFPESRSGLCHSQGGHEPVRGRHVRPEIQPAYVRGGGVDQLHRIYKGQSGQHGLHLVRLPQRRGAGGVHPAP